MSDNFYWRVEAPALPTGEPVPLDLDHPAIHICQTTQDKVFWAQDPNLVAGICGRRPNEPLIVNEAGRVLTGHEFSVEVLARNNWQMHLIGEHFS